MWQRLLMCVGVFALCVTAVLGQGAGDMTKAQYDQDDDGRVDQLGYGLLSQRDLLDPAEGDLFILVDANLAGDCVNGGGVSLALCRFDGSVWEAVGDGTSSNADTMLRTVYDTDGDDVVDVAEDVTAGAVDLGSETSGNYVSAIFDGDGISGADGGGEGSVLSLSATLGSSIQPGEMADADHGPFSYFGGFAQLDSGVVGSDQIVTGAVGALQLDPALSQAWTGDHTFDAGASFGDNLLLSDDVRFGYDAVQTGVTPTLGVRFEWSRWVGLQDGSHPNDQSNEGVQYCLNCRPGDSAFRQDKDYYLWNRKDEQAFWDGETVATEYNWNVVWFDADIPGRNDDRFRPFFLRVLHGGECVGGTATNSYGFCMEDADCTGSGVCSIPEEKRRTAQFTFLTSDAGYCGGDRSRKCTVETTLPGNDAYADCAGLVPDSCQPANQYILRDDGRIEFDTDRLLIESVWNEEYPAGRIASAIKIDADVALPDTAGQTDDGVLVRGIDLRLDVGPESSSTHTPQRIVGTHIDVNWEGPDQGGDTVGASGGQFGQIVINRVSGAGDVTFPNFFGARFDQIVTAPDVEITRGGFLLLNTPFDSGNANYVGGHSAIHIADQLDLGFTSAIRIDEQSGGVNDGNLYFEGGNHDNGHLRLGSGHLWFDGAQFRWTADPSGPNNPNDGTPLGAAPAAPEAPERAATTVIVDPGAVESRTLFLADASSRIVEVHCVLVGSSDAAVEVQVFHGADRSSGTPLWSAARGCNSKTGQTLVGPVADDGIERNDWVWLTTTTTGDAPAELTIHLRYR
ncbi:MAG: hypothetical protein GY716_08995 [bacterium]|nr:hypothetical protein [bacterium]